MAVVGNFFLRFVLLVAVWLTQQDFFRELLAPRLCVYGLGRENASRMHEGFFTVQYRLMKIFVFSTRTHRLKGSDHEREGNNSNS